MVGAIKQPRLPQREWRPYKATKIDVLEFIHDKESVNVNSLMEEFGYTYQGAKKRLYHLHLQRLIVPLVVRGTWCVTDLAVEKLIYYKKL